MCGMKAHILCTIWPWLWSFELLNVLPLSPALVVQLPVLKMYHFLINCPDSAAKKGKEWKEKNLTYHATKMNKLSLCSSN